VITGPHDDAACRAHAPDKFEFLSSSWEGRPPHFDLLTGVTAVREGLVAGAPIDEMTASWPKVEADFARRREPYLLYE